MEPTHPKYLKPNQIIYDVDGNQIKLAYVRERAGIWEISGVKYDKLVEWTYDSHDYSGNGGSPIPELYRKNPRGKGT